MKASLIAAGTFVLAGVGYLILHAVGDFAADEAKEAVFRRPSFAARRSRHRGLMGTGFVCGVLALLAGVLWLAAATSGRDSDAADARLFAIVAAVLAVVSGGFLTTWWRRAGAPEK